MRPSSFLLLAMNAAVLNRLSPGISFQPFHSSFLKNIVTGRLHFQHPSCAQNDESKFILTKSTLAPMMGGDQGQGTDLVTCCKFDGTAVA